MMRPLAEQMTLRMPISDPKAAFWPIVKWAGGICLLIFPANFSTAAMLFFICCVLMYIGGINWKLIAKLVGGIAVALAFGLLLALAVPQIREIGRVSTWLHRIGIEVPNGKVLVDNNNDDYNFQADHSKMAIVHGGIMGQGPGNSTQRNFLPHPYSDFIYAIIVEEYGIFGGSVVLAFYLWLLYRIRMIVRRSRSAFGTFLCIGLGISLVIQALVNMGVAVNIFPVTGQTLPLVSMGGTSVVFTSIAIGVILNVSRYAEGGDLAVQESVIDNSNKTTDN